MAWLAIFALVLVALGGGVWGQSDINEANALIIIKESAGAAPQLINWNGTDPCGAAWLGVQCTPANGAETRSVIGLQLPGFGLTGTLSPALGQLPNLRILDVSRNQLEGGIPREFQNLTQMEQLDLHSNNLVATLDPWVGYMPRLVRMDLSDNSVWGPLPDPLFRLGSLEELNLGGCIFTGAIPPTITGLTSLRMLNLSANYLKGPIPPELGQMTQLQALLLPNNSFSGSIPAALANITNLNYLYLQGNNLTGLIPFQITGLPNLVARFDGNPLCQQLENQPLCAVLPRDMPPTPTTAVIPNLSPGNGSGIVYVPPYNATGISVNGPPRANGMCVPGTLQGCVCADGRSGRGECSGDGMALLNCGCSYGTSEKRWSTTATVLVSVLPAAFVLALVAVGACCVLYCLRQRRAEKERDRREHVDTWKDDLERGIQAQGADALQKPMQRHVPLGSDSPIGGGAHFATNTPPRPPKPPPPPLDPSRFAETPEDEELATTPLVSGARSPIKGAHVSNPLYEVGKGGLGPVIRSPRAGSRTPRNGSRTPRRGNRSPRVGTPGKNAPGDLPREFLLTDILKATESFSPQHLLGRSGFGRSYLCALGGENVVVKRLYDLQASGVLAGNEPPSDAFLQQVALMSLLTHPNLIKLIGYCNQHDERCLILPHMPNKSLAERLHGTFLQPLDWRQRLTLVAQSAAALAYLHHHGVIHRNFCSSNVLFDEDMRAVVADYGAVGWSFDAGPAIDAVTLLLVGPGGYLAPEYGQGDVTDKADVYSFGVVLLELMTARPAISRDGVPLARWAANELERDPRFLEELIDPRLQGSWPSIPFFWTVELAQACISADPSDRPAMADVERAINFVLQHAAEDPASGGLNRESSSHNWSNSSTSSILQLSREVPVSRELPVA